MRALKSSAGKSDRNGDNGAESGFDKPAHIAPVPDTQIKKSSVGSAISKSSASHSIAPMQDGIKDFFGKLFGQNQNDSKKTPEEVQKANSNSNMPSVKSEDKKEEAIDIPEWMVGNYFSPKKTIPSQMWTTYRILKAMEAMPRKASLSFSPGRIPAPYLYAVSTLGASFNPILQSWTFGRSAQKYFVTPGEGPSVGSCHSPVKYLPVKAVCQFLSTADW